MTVTKELALKLLNSIKIDINQTRSLAELLKQEKKFLELREINQFEQLTEKKNILLEDMAKQQKFRDTIQITAGFMPGGAGIREIFKMFPEDLAEQKQAVEIELEKILLLTEELALINAKIIANNNAQINRMLKVMYNKKDFTYSSSGQTESSEPNNIITKA